MQTRLKKFLGSCAVTTKFLIGRMFFIVFPAMDSFAPKVASLRPFLFWDLRSILRNGTAWQQPARTLHEQQNGRWHVMCQQGLRWLQATAGSIPRGLPLAAAPHAWGFLWANGQLDRAHPTPWNSSSIGNLPNLGTEGLDSTVTVTRWPYSFLDSFFAAQPFHLQTKIKTWCVS